MSMTGERDAFLSKKGAFGIQPRLRGIVIDSSPGPRTFALKYFKCRRVGYDIFCERNNKRWKGF